MNKICVIGCGYVGLPLLVELSEHYNVIGIEKSKSKINLITSGKIDFANTKKLKKNKVYLTDNIYEANEYNVFIICVPTPIWSNKKPNLSLLTKALNDLKKIIKKNDTIIFESTYYPGLSRELTQKFLCFDDLKIGKNLNLGYSPERINPGDKVNTLRNTTKLISGDSYRTIKKLKSIYAKVCNNIHICNSIEEAEMSKLIENTQRDINISYINEIFKICISTNLKFTNVINAAATKWNFLKLNPGLVGGHCISVDTYYLKEFAKKNNINSKVITSGRDTNEKMKFFYQEIINKYLIKKNSKILFLGKTFKENVADFRNSKNIELIELFSKNKGLETFSYDPLLEMDTNLNMTYLKKKYDLIIILVGHNQFDLKFIKKILKNNLFSSGKLIDFSYRDYGSFKSKKIITF